MRGEAVLSGQVKVKMDIVAILKPKQAKELKNWLAKLDCEIVRVKDPLEGFSLIKMIS